MRLATSLCVTALAVLCGSGCSKQEEQPAARVVTTSMRERVDDCTRRAEVTYPTDARAQVREANRCIDELDHG